MKHTWSPQNRCQRCGLERLQQGRYYSPVYGSGVFHLYRVPGEAWKRDLPRCFDPRQGELFAAPEHRETFQPEPPFGNSTRTQTALLIPQLEQPSHHRAQSSVTQFRPSNAQDHDVTLAHNSHPAMTMHDGEVGVTLMLDQHGKWFGRAHRH